MRSRLHAAFALLLIVAGANAQVTERPELLLQSGHSNYVSGVALSPDGRLMASGSGDGTVRIWNAATGQLIRIIDLQSSEIGAVAFSPDGHTLAVAIPFRPVTLLDTRTWQMRRRLSGATNGASVVFSGDGRYIAASAISGGVGNDATQVWEADTGAMFARLSGHAQAVRSVDFSPTADRIVAAGRDGKVKVWALETGTLIHEFAAETWVEAVAFAPDGQRVLAAGGDAFVRIWNAVSGEALPSLRANAQRVSALAYSADGSLLAAGGQYGTVTLWDGASLRPMGELRHGMTGNSIAVSADGRRIATGSSTGSGRVALWNARTGEQIGGSLGRRSSLIPTYSPDGRYIAAAAGDRTIKLWDSGSAVLLDSLAGAADRIASIGFSPDGRRIAAGSMDSSVELWDVGGGLVKRLEGHRERVESVAFSPDGKLLASAGWDETVRLWDVERGRQVRRMNTGTALVDTVRFSPDGTLIALAASDAIKLWSATTGREVHAFEDNTPTKGLAFSPDGRLFATGGGNWTIKLWDTETASMRRTVKGRSIVNALAFSPDGRLVASAHQANTVEIWDVQSGTRVHTLRGHSSSVESVAFSPDGRRVVSAGRDGQANIWSTKDGVLLVTLIAFDDGNWISYTPQGYYVGSDEASQYVTWRLGDRVLGFDQFFEQFYRPDLIDTVLREGRAPGAPGIAAGFASPPELEILSPAAGAIVAETEIEVVVKATDTGGGIAEIRLRHNGKVVDTPGQATGDTVTYRVLLVDGPNTFSVTGFSRDRTESSPRDVSITSTVPGSEARVFLLAVGINEYENSVLDLNFAVPDAEGVASFFGESGTALFEAVDVRRLYDEEAARAAIVEALESLEREARPQDVVILYFAGHGDSHDGEWYFVPHDLTRPERDDELKSGGISSTQLAAAVTRIPSRKVLLLLDACRSGAALQAFRGYEDRKALAQLARSSGIHIVAASSSEQLASELAQLGHGVFTHVLLKGLRGEAVLVSAPHTVTVRGLLSYVEAQLPGISRLYRTEAQYPVSTSRGNDFPLAIVN